MGCSVITRSVRGRPEQRCCPGRRGSVPTPSVQPVTSRSHVKCLVRARWAGRAAPAGSAWAAADAGRCGRWSLCSYHAQYMPLTRHHTPALLAFGQLTPYYSDLSVDCSFRLTERCTDALQPDQSAIAGVGPHRTDAVTHVMTNKVTSCFGPMGVLEFV